MKIHYDIQGKYKILIGLDDLIKKINEPTTLKPEVTADLVILSAKGLLEDWGAGRMDYHGPEKFILTELTKKIINLVLD
ncbi:hypothetical protein [Leptospira interrogans]|uniref:hypothetical protein n=1 Tax=Leptospira interrogans TaxID=173 RepID=UPI000A7B8D27|nr:hypothetical protein [Leptospira interrogans]